MKKEKIVLYGIGVASLFLAGFVMVLLPVVEFLQTLSVAGWVVGVGALLRGDSL